MKPSPGKNDMTIEEKLKRCPLCDCEPLRNNHMHGDKEFFCNTSECLLFRKFFPSKFIATFTINSKPTDYNHRFLINNAINAKALLKELGELPE